MDRDLIIKLTAQIDVLPTLPAIVNQVLSVTANPESSAQDLLAVIEPDPAMTAKILEMANSAFYSRANKVVTLKQALMTIGFNEVRNIVLSLAVSNNFSALSRVRGFDPYDFWRHAFIVGIAAKLIAGGMQLKAGDLFVAGLIHDIGKLALLIIAPDGYARIMKMTGNYGLEHLAAEKHVLGLNHAQVGMRLANKWMLPESLVAAVGYHHEPGQANESQVVYPLVVHLSDCLSHILALSQQGEGQPVIPEGCFSAETAAYAKRHGIDWHMETVEAYLVELKALIEHQSSVLDALLST